MRKTWKKAAAFAMALALVAGAAPANVGTGGLFGGVAITAKAAPSEPDSGVKAGNVDVSTTVSWDADEMSNSGDSSFSKDGVTVETENGAHVINNFYYFGKNTFKADGGKITKIEIVCHYCDDNIDGWSREAVGQYQPEPEGDPDWWENINKLTWTGEADSVSIQNAVYEIQSLKVTYIPSATDISTAEESESFSTNTRASTYTGDHFKIEVTGKGDEDGFMLNDEEGGMPATITALNGEVITKIELVRGHYDGEPHVSSESAVKSVSGDTFTFTNINATSVVLDCCTGGEFGFCQIKQVKIYYGDPVYDLSTATVNLAADNSVASITVGNDTITDLSGFDITYGTDDSHTATSVPTDAGTYYAYVTSKSTNTAYTGTAKSASFEVAAAPTISSASVTLGDDLALNFYVDGIADDTAAAEYSVKFEGECVDKTSALAYNAAVGKYYATTHIYAKDINQKITAKLYKGENECGTSQISVADYLTILAASPDKKTQALALATKLFGDASAAYFNPTETVNDTSVAAEITTYMTQANISDAALTAMAAQYAPTFDSDAAKLSLVLDSKTAARLYVKDDTTGTESTINATKADYPSYHEVAGLLPQNLADEQTINVGGTDYKFSALSWCSRVLTNGSASQKNINMAKAIMAYYTAAKAYKTVDVASVAITNAPTEAIKVGNTGTLNATVSPDNATNKTVTWAVTEGTDVLSINAATGAYTALKAGTAKVTATAGGKSSTCVVTVEAAGPATVVAYSFDDANSPSLTPGSRVSFDYSRTSVITNTAFLNAYNNANGDPGASTLSLGDIDLSDKTWTLTFEWAACGGCNSKLDHTTLKSGAITLFDIGGNSNWNTTVTISYDGSDGTKTLPVPGCDKSKRFKADTGDLYNTTTYWHHIVVTGSASGVKMTITNSETGTVVVEDILLSSTNVNPTSLIIEPCCGGAIGIDELLLTYTE